MADPAVRAVGAVATINSTSLSMVVPASAVVGDLLVLWNTTSSATALILPSGWDSRASAVVGTTSQLTSLLCTRPCVSGDPGSTVTVSSANSGKRVGVIVAIKNVSPSTPIDVVTALLGDITTTGVNSRPIPTGSSVGVSELPILFVGDRAAGVIPPNDGIASDTWTFPGPYSDGQVVAGRSGAVVNGGDVSLAIALGDPVAAGAALGGGNYVAHYKNGRACSVIMAIRAGPVIYPQLDVLEAGVWKRANVLGVGSGGALVPVEILNLTPTLPPATPDLAFDFNDGTMPASFTTHTGATIIPAAAYAGANGARLTPDPTTGVATLTIGTTRFPIGDPWCGFKMRFRLNSAPSSAATYMNLFEIGNALTTAPKSQFTMYFDTGNLNCDFNAGEEQTIAATPSVGGWHLIEVVVGFGGTSYVAKIRYDGGAVITFTSPATKTPTTANVLWIHYPDVAVDYQMDVDDIALVCSPTEPGFFA